jgi:probable phosphoglycerate mutase
MPDGGVSEEKPGPEKLQRFMLRHGKPLFPGAGSYIYGHTDYPLSDCGVSQARRIGEVLSGIRMERVVSSDLSRALETARIVAGLQRGGVEVEADPEIREIFMGEWDGLGKEEIKEKYADIFRERALDLERVAAPGGETFVEARDRGARALSRIIGESVGMSRIMIVAHGAIIWGMISSLFGIRLGDIFRFEMDFCAMHIVERGNVPAQWGQFRLLRYNWFPDPVNEGCGVV